MVCGIGDVSQNDLPGIQQHLDAHTKGLHGRVIDLRLRA
jgi:hypothetical protein